MSLSLSQINIKRKSRNHVANCPLDARTCVEVEMSYELPERKVGPKRSGEPPRVATGRPNRKAARKLDIRRRRHPAGEKLKGYGLPGSMNQHK